MSIEGLVYFYFYCDFISFFSLLPWVWRCMVSVVTLFNLIAQVLEFLPELLDTLKDEGYALTESEVAVFLPCLVEKVSICNYFCRMFLFQ